MRGEVKNGGRSAQRARQMVQRQSQAEHSAEAAHVRLINLYLHSQQDAHARALREMTSGRKLSHWIWWEWPAFAPVRRTSRPEYDLPSCAACAAWLSHDLLGQRWAEMTSLATRHLEQGAAAADVFGSRIDATKFHESSTLVSLCAPKEEQRMLATRALRALALPPHAAVLRATEAERYGGLMAPTSENEVRVLADAASQPPARHHGVRNPGHGQSVS